MKTKNLIDKQLKRKRNPVLVDSILTAILCKEAGLALYGVFLPYGSGELDRKQELIEFLNLSENRSITIDITFLVDNQVEEIQKIVKLDKTDKGNIMARQRMIIQYALARQLDALVVGTENLSEYYLGYFTLHGDQASDINPISGLFKTQVYRIAEYLKAPEWILSKSPSAGLWPGQTDAQELGFGYEEADPIIYLSIIKKYSKEKIIEQGFEQKLVDRVLKKVANTRYKREDCVNIVI